MSTLATRLRRLWPRVLVGIATGSLVGLAAFGAPKMNRALVFVLIGALAGCVVGMICDNLGRTVRLTTVRVGIPHFSELTFAVTKGNSEVAWILFVETVTRVSIQALAADAGNIREALSSIHDLFRTIRETLKETKPGQVAGGGPTVEHLAIAMLNRELRPFLAQWHPALGVWEATNAGVSDSQWGQAAECRLQLQDLQKRLSIYVIAFGRLALVPDVSQIVDGAVDPALLVTSPTH